MLLELKNISMRFDVVEAKGVNANGETEGKPTKSAQVDILQNVTLSLDRGESVAVVAPSGAGKSTLLSVAGLLLSPTEGSVWIDGTNATDLSDDERSALRANAVGFLFQHTQLIGSLRAIENVILPADFACKGHDGAERLAKAQERAESMMCDFGLEGRKYHYPFQLSVGQKRRIATARALVLDPPLIIADEPTNDLDAENTQRVVEALFARVEAGEAGLLLATHDQALAARADRVYHLSNNKRD